MYHFTKFLHFAIEIKKKYIIFRKAQKSRMQMFEELQFGHPCIIISNIVLKQNFIYYR